MSRKSQDPIKLEDLEVFFNYALTGTISSEEEATKLRRLSKRTVTLADVTLLFNVLSQRKDQAISQLMETVQVQDFVLEQLGATEEIFDKAKKEYADRIEAKREEMRAAVEALKASQEEKK